MQEYHHRNEVKLFKIFLGISIFLISLLLAKLGLELCIELIDRLLGIPSDIISGVFVAIISLAMKLILYLVFLILIPFLLWKLASFLLNKYEFYPFLLDKTNDLSNLSSWAIWIGASLVPLLASAIFLNTPRIYKTISSDRKDASYNNKTMTISGKIDKDIKYKIKTNYLATYDSSRCKQRILLSGTPHYKKRTLEYQPSTIGNQHQIKIPLSSKTGDSFCEYQIKNIQICFTVKGSKKSGCWNLFVTENDSQYMSDGRRYKESNNSNLTIKCTEDGYCTQDLHQRESITQYLNKDELDYTVDIDLISNKAHK